MSRQLDFSHSSPSLMLKHVVGFVLEFRVLVLAVAAAFLFFGLLRLPKLPVDVLPEFAPLIVEIQTEAPGLSASEVELMVSFGVEELVSGLPWVKSLTSNSVTGLSTVRLEFKPGTSLMLARQLVQERLTTAFLLPNVAKPPVMQQPVSSYSRVMMIAMSSEKIDPLKLSVLSLWTVKPKLMGVPGVARVSVWGERRRQIQIRVDPDKMEKNKITQRQVIATSGNALWVSSLSFLRAAVPGTGGWISTPNQRLEVRHILPISSSADMAKLRIEGSDLQLNDVADVVEGHPPLIGDAILPDSKNQQGLLLVIEKFPGASTLQVTRAVEKALDELRPGMKGVKIDTLAFRPATLIESSMENIKQTFLISIMMVVIGLGLLLAQWRTMVVALVVIPVTVLAAVLVLNAQGLSLNMVTIAGIAVVALAVIDDVVHSIHNIMVRLHKGGEAKPVLTVIRQSLLYSFKSIAVASMIAALIAVPIFFLVDIEGALLQPLALSYVIALGASMVTALSVMSALVAVLFLIFPVSSSPKTTSPLSSILQDAFSGSISEAAKRVSVVLMVLLPMAVIWLVSGPLLFEKSGQTHVAMMPDFNERDIVISFDGQPGTSLKKMRRVVAGILEDIKAVSGVRSAYGHIGRAVGGDQTVPIHSARLWVSINSNANRRMALAAINRKLRVHRNFSIKTEGYLAASLNHVSSSAQDQITIRVYGHELDQLRKLAQQVRSEISRIDGLLDITIHDLEMEPQIQVRVDLTKAAKLGINPGDVRRAAATIFSGVEVGRIFEAQKVYEVVVWSKPENRQKIEDVARARIELPGGGYVSIGEIATISLATTPTLIKREGVSSYLDVTAKRSGRRTGAVMTDINHVLSDISYPMDYHSVVLGQGIDDNQSSTLRVVVATLIALVIGVLLMQAAFGSWHLAVVMYAAMPFALSGGVLAVLFVGAPLSIGMLCGFYALYMLTARQSMSLISNFQRLEANETEEVGPSLVIRGTLQMLSPILTSLVSVALVVAPVIYMGGLPGFQILYPMALIVLGGLISLFIFLLFAVPGIYLIFGAQQEVEVPGKEVVQ